MRSRSYGLICFVLLLAGCGQPAGVNQVDQAKEQPDPIDHKALAGLAESFTGNSNKSEAGMHLSIQIAKVALQKRATVDTLIQSVETMLELNCAQDACVISLKE